MHETTAEALHGVYEGQHQFNQGDEMTMINISGISKPKLLAALFNASKQQGMGFLDARGQSAMTEQDAEKVIAEDGMYFDYLRGRVMKVDISGDELRPYAYDRDNGDGAAGRVISLLQLEIIDKSLDS